MESVNANLALATENKTHFINSACGKKENKYLKITRTIETSETISLTEANIMFSREKEKRSKKSRRHVCIIHDSMVKSWFWKF